MAVIAIMPGAPSNRLEYLQRSDVTLLAAEATKARATLTVLRAGFVNRLVADEQLTRALLVAADEMDRIFENTTSSKKLGG